MNKLDEIRQILRDKEDFSYTAIDKLIDIIDLQQEKLCELDREIRLLNERIDNLDKKIE